MRRLALLLCLAALGARAQAPETAFTLDDRAFAAEGIALLPDSSFAVGSVHLGTIVRVDGDGRVTPFAEAPGRWSVLGMTVSPDRRSLWAATVAWPQARGADTTAHGRTALVRFDLATGAVQGRIETTGALGDVTVGPDGAVYATDGLAGTVRVLDGDSLRTLVPRGVLHSPQGLAFGRDPSRLFVVDYRYGLVAVDVRTGGVTLVPHVPGVEDRGADGLVYAGGTLYAVQNGVQPHRVARWRLSPDEARVVEADVLASAEGDDRFDEPTLAAVAGPWLYVVSASGWAHFSDDGTLDVEAAPVPTVLRIPR
ncbi:SMP-30/gluconolactonase/LRE family protein [Rubrivirga marina]|uniref:SMP-30/Gluconolactonase/LRE-like region domain-containing protein n=1 Tax=Rubrivirga marina TaxID=1196024 RepID=A0A271IYZ0_9BACT|nr:hypothetical protein [Rubrivirga marina]PAP76471.1 hypothetical protein BSZ37_08470 [Rubrivirga marina]